MNRNCFNRQVSFTSWRENPLFRVFPSERKQDTEQLNSPSPGQTNGSERNSRPSEKLIRSPIEARIARAAALRQKKPNPTPSEPDPLRHNPWAQMLASPPRLCNATHTRVPTALMLDFGLIKRPDANEYWYMPTRLMKDDIREMERKPTTDEEADGEKRQLSKTPVPQVRVTNSLAIVDMLANAKRILISKLFRHKLRYPMGPLTKEILNSLVWRKDMADFVLQQLRKNATKKLKVASLADRSPNITPEAWTPLHVNGDLRVKQLGEAMRVIANMENASWGAVLVIGPKSEHRVPNVEAEGPKPESSESSPLSPDNMHNESPSKEAIQLPIVEAENPNHDSPLELDNMHNELPSKEPNASLPDLIQLPDSDAKVPIFDLRTLLSEDNITNLRDCHPVFHNDVLFFRATKHISPQPLVALMQLKGHLLDGKDLSP